jgi:Domain of unknown function (DUF6265)
LGCGIIDTPTLPEKTMRILATLTLLASSTALPATAPDLARLEWLAGCWRSPAGERSIGEFWTTAADGLMLGMSRTLRGGRLEGFEFMQIKATAQGLVFVAQPSGEPPTVFALKQLTTDEVVFENAGHDFPQRVIYSRRSNGLSARIEGMVDGKPRGIDYPMVSTRCDEHLGHPGTPVPSGKRR